jgi:hypothetical protein
VLSKQSAKQFPDLSRRFHLGDVHGRLHGPPILLRISIVDNLNLLLDWQS